SLAGFPVVRGAASAVPVGSRAGTVYYKLAIPALPRRDAPGSPARSPDAEYAVTIPKVAIVGRPNVGKSSLFNSLAGRRIAIVDPTAGVTRDRVSTLLQAGSRYLELVDT